MRSAAELVYIVQIAFMKERRAKYENEIAIITQFEDHRLSLSGKRKVNPPIAISANGYQTFKCTNPGRDPALAHLGGQQYYPKRSASSLW